MNPLLEGCATAFAAIGVILLLSWWLAAGLGMGNPSPRDIAAKCRTHDRVDRVASRPWPEQRVIVICKDGTVHDAP